MCPGEHFAAAGALGWAADGAAATQPGHAGPCSCHCSSRLAAACSCWHFTPVACAASWLGAASCCGGASGAAFAGGSTWQHCSWHVGQEDAACSGVVGYLQDADTSAKQQGRTKVGQGEVELCLQWLGCCSWRCIVHVQHAADCRRVLTDNHDEGWRHTPTPSAATTNCPRQQIQPRTLLLFCHLTCLLLRAAAVTLAAVTA
jgi:hypothetical protein